tara:strand:+ start:592 stop:5091 length:4500 start_codon:yes stop_codon:yes gene_type:complete
MIDLSNKFQLDISSNTYSIQPLIVIEVENNPIYISTYRQNFNINEENSVYWEDYNLSISNISESIDYNNKSFKTSKLDFTLSNYIINGRRISDDIAQYSLINKYVDVYYKTQSCSELKDCALVYRGLIKSVKHDSKTIRIILEDLTEDKLNIKVPIASLGYTDNVFTDKYLNKEIPITYGSAFKAPAVLYVNKESTESDTLFAMVDDVFNSAGIEGREINLGGFEGIDERIFTFTSDKNPLFLFNEQYFKVLETYNKEVLSTVDSAVTNWDDFTQYDKSPGNYIEIPRLFTGQGQPKNPPAYNEVQTIITRNPIQMLKVKDSTDNLILYDNNITLSKPVLAYDSPSQFFLSSSYNLDIGASVNPYDTKAVSPPEAGAGYGENFSPEYPGQDLYLSFSAHKIEEDVNPNDQFGCWLPKYGDIGMGGMDGEYLTQYQFKVFQFLNFNMDKINKLSYDPDNPNIEVLKKVTYIQMPSIQNVKERVNKMLSLRWYNYMGSSAQDITLDAFQNNGHDSDYVDWFQPVDYNGEDDKMTAYPLICPNFADYFQSQHGSSGNTEGKAWAHTSRLGGINEDYNGTVNFPQPTAYRLRLAGDIPGSGNPPQRIGSICFVTQRTDFMTGSGFVTEVTYDGDYIQGAFYPDNHNEYGAYYDLLYDPSLHGNEDDFMLGSSGGRQYLFHPRELAQFSPVEVESRIRPETVDEATKLQASIQYTCIAENADKVNVMQETNASGEIAPMSDKKYFGYRGQDGLAVGSGYGCYKDNGAGGGSSIETHPIGMRDVYRSGDGNKCWAIWVREDLQGESLNENHLHDDFDEDFKTLEYDQDLLIPKGTILPCAHMTNEYDSGWQNADIAVFGSVGSFNPADDPDYEATFNQIYDTNGTASGVRFGFAFQLEDINDDDFIKCDTYFTGKIHCIFDNANTDNNSDRFKLALSTAFLDSKEGGIISQDVNVEDLGDNLINIPLSDIGTGNNQYETHIFSIRPEDSNNNSWSNSFSGEEFIQKDNWTSPNSFNGFTLNYFIDSDGDGGIDESRANVQTELYDAAAVQIIQFTDFYSRDLYLFQNGRMNNPEDYIELDDGSLLHKYTGAEWAEDYQSLIKQPQDILYHFVEKELSLTQGVNQDDLNKARAANLGDYAFSLNKKIKAKDFINDFVKSTNISPIFKSTSEFGFSTLKNTYNDDDVNFTIITSDIVSYKFSRTTLSQINTIVNVKYAYDYGNDSYAKETGYVDGYDLFGNGDSGFRETGYSYDYFNLDRDSKVLEFESKYIRDNQTAIAFRNFLYLYNCNQHNKVDLTLPNKYIFLEAGDVIKFDKLIQDVKAYGEDYTIEETRNSQKIYPFFIIDYVSKKANGVNIRCTQLHKLTRRFSPVLGSVSRNIGQNDIGLTPGSDEDKAELNSFLNGSNKYFTRDQRRVSDMNLDGYIDSTDLIGLEELTPPTTLLPGDLNVDGAVNVMDAVLLLNSLIDEDQQISEDYFERADVNGDGLVNIVDIVAIVDQIMGDSDV